MFWQIETCFASSSLAVLEPTPKDVDGCGSDVDGCGSDADGCGSVGLTSLFSPAASVSSFSISSDATLSFSAPSALLSSVKTVVQQISAPSWIVGIQISSVFLTWTNGIYTTNYLFSIISQNHAATPRINQLTGSGTRICKPGPYFITQVVVQNPGSRFRFHHWSMGKTWKTKQLQVLDHSTTVELYRL